MTDAAQEGSAKPANTRSRPCSHDIWKRLLGVALFAFAMGLLEAICVVYLRRLILPAGTVVSHPLAPVGGMPVEHIREACTLVMLITVAWMTAFNWRSRTAHFFFMFGVWDITYYVGLKWLVHWPASWLQWDCLFLIPEPWYGPVLAPVLISGYLILVSCLALAHETSEAKGRLSAWALSLQAPGFLLWYWSFVKDSEIIRTRGYTSVSYSWLLFACGLVIAALGLAFAQSAGRLRKRNGSSVTGA